MFEGIWRDLVYAGRSLAKARAFTLVCVVSLGIGMVPVIAVPYVSRITRTPPPSVKTEGLVEVVTTPLAENMGISLSNVEPLAYVAGAAIAILVAVLASLIPARRAASVHPMVAMRST